MALTYIQSQPTRIKQLARVDNYRRPRRIHCIHDKWPLRTYDVGPPVGVPRPMRMVQIGRDVGFYFLHWTLMQHSHIQPMGNPPAAEV